MHFSCMHASVAEARVENKSICCTFAPAPLHDAKIAREHTMATCSKSSTGTTSSGGPRACFPKRSKVGQGARAASCTKQHSLILRTIKYYLVGTRYEPGTYVYQNDCRLLADATSPCFPVPLFGEEHQRLPARLCSWARRANESAPDARQPLGPPSPP